MFRRQGFAYELPPLDEKFAVRAVLEGDSGPEMALMLRKTVEAFFLSDKTGAPEKRWVNFMALHESVRLEALRLGFTDVQAMLPPQISRSFGKRLGYLGWRMNTWPLFTKVLAE